MCTKIGRKPEEGERLVLSSRLPGYEQDENDDVFYGDDKKLYKKCDQCGKVKPYDEFPDNQNSNMSGVDILSENGYTGHVCKKRKTCNECRKPNGKKHSMSANVVWKKHNLPNPTEKTVCGMCGKTYEQNGNRVMFRDHCHETDTPRGYLCHDCNTGLGKLGDNPEKINERLTNYIKDAVKLGYRKLY